jgi:hypothetical protein
MFDFPIPRTQLGRRLNMDELSSHFDKCWDNMKYSYFQYERLQDYQELDNPSYIKFKEGNMKEAVEKLYESVCDDVPYYREICRKGISYVRVHTVNFPLTDYIKWELHSYSLLCQFGQRILLADITSEPRDSDLWCSYDFLLFDSDTVMVQDYGDDGILCGGWITEDSQIVKKFDLLSKKLTSASIPLGEFKNTKLSELPSNL